MKNAKAIAMGAAITVGTVVLLENLAAWGVFNYRDLVVARRS